MQSFRACCLTLLMSACAASTAQSGPSKVEPELAPGSYGTVTGHVYLAGSDTPARLVNVNLQPLHFADEKVDWRPGRVIPLPVTVYQTGLDGGYTIPRVAPGTYYVLVNAPGMLSPFAAFTQEELRNPTPEIARRIAASLPVISVGPNATTTHDVRLQRGASLSGTVRFDDGTPFPGAVIEIRRHDTDGKWIGTSSYSQRPLPDAEGHWQRTGLLPGEYRIGVKLELNDHKQSSGFTDNSSSSSFTRYELDFYLGDTAHKAEAKTVKLEENEQRTGQDVTVPISKLHVLSGAVVDAANGRPLNAGTIRLMYASGGEQVADTSIDGETRTFTFPFVPEGEYKLKVENPHEARFEPLPSGEGDPNFPERFRKETALRQYAPAEMPVVVQTDMGAVNLAVVAKAAEAGSTR